MAESAEQVSQQVASALTLPYLNHAVRMLGEGYATAADIDNAMRFGCGYPAGPLATVDSIGARAVREGLVARYAGTRDPRHRPAELLERAASDGSRLAAAADSAEPTPRLRREIATIGVVGTGTMAAGIVQVFAQSGYAVVVVGRSRSKLDGLVDGLATTLDRAIAKGRLPAADRAAVLGRVSCTTARDDLASVDLVVEAIAEDLVVKTELFAELDRICRPGTILATTTSSLPITELAKVVSRPQDVLGMHFFNPAPVMRLVEVVCTDLTGPDVDETVRSLCAATRKVAVSCGDRAGFIVNCLLFPYLNDAVRLHESGVPITDIEAAVKTHAGFPMGPFELLDVVGNDVSLAIQTQLHREFGEPGLAPARLLERKVADGDLGRKTGRGFHDYRS